MTVFAAHTTVILRSRALARRLEGSLTGFSCPSFEARREGRRAPQNNGGSGLTTSVAGMRATDLRSPDEQY
jgi:hypothetical protein